MNVLAAHDTKAIGELIEMLSTFRKQNLGSSQVMAIDFKRKFNVRNLIVIDLHLGWVLTVCQEWPKRLIGALWPAFHSGRYLAVVIQTFSTMKEMFEQAHHTITSLDSNLNSFLRAASNFLDWYTQLFTTKNLFEVTIETNLLAGIKNIMHELEIINCVGLQQEAAIKPFMREMLHRSVDGQDTFFHNGISWGNRIKVLQRKDQLTYTALQVLLDIKQNQATARAARNDAKASARQADLAAELSFETIRQGSVIMVFTIVTIIFHALTQTKLPLSFFTGLFGMNAKELNSGNYSIGFYSAIMCKPSLVRSGILSNSN
ncbi:hypothetical protein NA56DRAFT_662622 [Hyaloscypha hepaticicola]|uniref:Uncharacterized protein n=1 Tax=Hyaloscypha hepaticicola TaxID=2082293 RepID=A0A2J6PSK4_9HELO|nr:hypothetical protein NA56DRAFT_662622 [Hyaloscypha hepaticicola]